MEKPVKIITNARITPAQKVFASVELENPVKVTSIAKQNGVKIKYVSAIPPSIDMQVLVNTAAKSYHNALLVYVITNLKYVSDPVPVKATHGNHVEVIIIVDQTFVSKNSISALALHWIMLDQEKFVPREVNAKAISASDKKMNSGEHAND